MPVLWFWVVPFTASECSSLSSNLCCGWHTQYHRERSNGILPRTMGITSEGGLDLSDADSIPSRQGCVGSAKSLIVQGRLQILNDSITEFCNIKIVSLGSVQITEEGYYKKGTLPIWMSNTFIVDLSKSCRRKWDINEQVHKGRYMAVFVSMYTGVICRSVPSLYLLSKTFDAAEKCTGFVMENPRSQPRGKEKEQNSSYSQILNPGTLVRKQNYFQEVSRGDGRRRNSTKGKAWAEF